MGATVMPLAGAAPPVSKVSFHAAPRAATSSATVTIPPPYHAAPNAAIRAPSRRTRPRLTRSVLFVFRLDRRPQLVAARCREQPLAEVLVLEQTRYPGERLQMDARGVLGRDQQHEEPRRAAVERIEV